MLGNGETGYMCVCARARVRACVWGGGERGAYYNQLLKLLNARIFIRLGIQDMNSVMQFNHIT
jgi:hypothetical protein